MIYCGLDEVGKGDLFGPLILGAVVSSPELEKLPNVKDSKKLSNNAIFVVANEIKKVCSYELSVIHPFYYNNLYEKYQNQALLLKEVYIDFILRLTQTFKIKKFVIDKFFNGDIHTIQIDGLDIQMEHKAEASYISVAAASILAREALLKWFLRHPKLHMGSTRDASKRLKNVPLEKREYFVKQHFRV